MDHPQISTFENTTRLQGRKLYRTGYHAHGTIHNENRTHDELLYERNRDDDLDTPEFRSWSLALEVGLGQFVEDYLRRMGKETTNSGNLHSPAHKQQFYEVFSAKWLITDEEDLPIAHSRKDGQPQVGEFRRIR